MQFPTRVSAALMLSFLALGTVATAQNQYVTLYPGASNASTIFQAYLPTSGGLLNKASINTLPAGTFQIIPMPDGTKYYVISNGGTPVSTMDSNFSIITQIAGSISLAPSAAAITPDGRKLVVTAGNNLYVIDTSSDTVIVQNGLVLPGKSVDIVINADSSRAFVLSQGVVGPAGTVVTAIDLTTAVPVIAGPSLTLNGDASSPATGLAIAPSGLLYMSNQYRIWEINPYTLTVTPGGEIPVLAYPGKPYITSDGKYLVAANLRPGQGGSLFVQVSLPSKTVASFLYTGDTLLQFFNQGPDSKGNSRLYASSIIGNLYDITLGANPIADVSNVNVLFPSAYTFSGGIQFSNENPPRLMWGAYTNGGNNYLVQTDLVNRSTPVQIPIPTASLKLGTLSTSPFTGGTTLLGFNNNQTVVPGAKTVNPIVAQLVDTLGRGIFRGQITFTTSTPGVTIATPGCSSATSCSFITGSGGFAQAFVTVPSTPGSFTVTANGGPGVTPLDFTFTVPGSTGGGGGGTGGLGGLFYVSGNGQLSHESYPLNIPLQVESRDANGKPLPNTSVTWTIIANQVTTGYTIPTVTDSTGRAILRLNGLPGVSQSGSPTISTNVTATDGLGNVVNFVFTTTAITLLNGLPLADPTVSESILGPNGEFLNQFPNGRVFSGPAGTVIKNAYIAHIVNTDGPFVGQGIANVGVCFTNNDPNQTDENPPGTPTGVLPTPTCGIQPIKPGPSADCVGTPLSDASGTVTCDLLLGPVLTKNPIKIYPIVGQLKNLPGFTLIVTTGPPAIITRTSGDLQIGKPSAALPIALGIKVTDVAGNPLGNQTVTWSTILGTGAKLSSTSSTTNNNGQASISVTLPPTPGPVKIQANVNKNLFVQFNLTVDAAIGSITVRSGDNQGAFTNQLFASPLVVLVTDTLGNPLPNTLVNFAAIGSGSVSPASVTTAADGTASTRLTAGTATGPTTVTAIVGSLQTSFNNLTVIPLGPQISTASFVNAASLQPGLSPCGLAVVQATGIAPGVNGTIAPTGFGPNPTTLGPVQSLTVNGIAAPLTSVSNINGVERVGFQMPCDVPVGLSTVVMNVNGGSTTVNNVVVSAYAPGMFESLAGDGRSYAVALRSDGSFIGPGNPATRGETIRVFVTGLGQTTPAIGTNRAGTGGQTVNAQVIGGVNNAGVLVVKSEYVAGQIGTYFVDIQIPIDTVSGSYQPIAVAVQPPGGGDLIFGNGVNIPIQ